MNSPPHRLALTGIALALSSVTVISVCLAILALIADPVLRWLFAGGAGLLDLAKYLSWPLAAHLLSAGRQWLAAALIVCALVLASVSGWATYDRLMAGMLGGYGEAAATQQRIADIEAARQIDLTHLAALDAERASAQMQAGVLRQRGIASKAQQLEDSKDAQREQVRRRLDDSSRELAELRAVPSRSASLPLGLAALLCTGFALALELVPALLLVALRGVAGEEQRENTPETQPATPETQPETGADHDPMLHELLRTIASAGPGSPVVLREFVRSSGVGNTRAKRLFQAAEERGALVRTPAGGYAAT